LRLVLIAEFLCHWISAKSSSAKSAHGHHRFSRQRFQAAGSTTGRSHVNINMLILLAMVTEVSPSTVDIIFYKTSPD